MRTFLPSLFLAVLLSSLLPSAQAHAGMLEPYFEEKLDALPQGSTAHGIVVMADRINPQELVHSLRHVRSLAKRHTAVIRTLTNKASETQTPFLRYLESQKRLGIVEKYRPFWITNMISVTGKKEVMAEIASRFDVGIVYEDFEIVQLEPVSTQPAGSDLTGHEPGLEGIGATDMWEMGITGEGVIVCNIDTGVDGNHVALADRWRGLEPDVDPSEAWYDPITETDFPFDSGSHGTHTMGTITGRAGSDTIGVAPDAQWVAAGVIDRVSGSGRFAVYASAFEWAADPDSNPDTFDEVPDVVSNSWGINSDLPACDSTFWEVIDNCEAAGAIVVFAAGNEGPGAASLRNPSDRNATDVNVFSVGALNTDQTTIASFSSRGPSTCDMETKKPEVCAQGVDVRSSVPGNGYSIFSGTSMACPHVAGAIGLLRQVDPNASPEDVKTAILLTAVDLGSPGDDNDYGMGRVDLVEASNWLGGLDELIGTVTDAATGDTLEGARVELPEIGEFDSTDTAGAYRFHMILPDTLLVVTGKFGYEVDSTTVFLVPDTVTVHDVSLNAMATGTIAGNVTDIDTGDGISADIEVFWLGISVATTMTDPGTGFYSVDLPAGFYDVTVIPESPYIGETATGVQIFESQVTTLDFVFQPVTTYTDVSASSGIEMGGYGQGCAWGDFDGDGDDDIYITNILGDNRLMRNDGGTFTDVAASMGVEAAGESFGTCWGDFDRDRDLDLFVAVRNDANKLYRNDGTSFTEISLSVGLTDTAYSQTAGFFDYNLDGRLDLFVANRSADNKLYRNDGGFFTDVTDAMGLTDPGNSPGFGIVDFSGDGYPDIFVLRKLESNVLYRNDVTTFTDVTATYGVGGTDETSNGCAWGDIDNDGDFDLYVSNSSAANFLYRNDGGSFTDISSSSGTNSTEPSFHSLWVDFDSDADLDLFVTNSTTSILYMNTGGGSFFDVSSISGTDIGLATGACSADFNLDGRPDLFIVRSNSQDDVLLQNDGNFNTWINIALRGNNSDVNGIGALISVTSNGETMMRQVAAGNGLFSQDSFSQHFGLVRETSVDAVTVDWPSGRTTTLTDISANQSLTIGEIPTHRVPFQF